MVLAKKQTKGRGKPGSFWYSPEGGLYFSLILKPRKNPADLAPLTLIMAEAVAGTIKREGGIDPEIKLPNDILIGGKKVCGILTEKTGGALILGVGLNLNIREFPEDLNATSLLLECGREFEWRSLLGKIMEAFKNSYSKFLFNKV